MANRLNAEKGPKDHLNAENKAALEAKKFKMELALRDKELAHREEKHVMQLRQKDLAIREQRTRDEHNKISKRFETAKDAAKIA